MNVIKPLSLTLSITLYANALASQLDDNQLDLIAAIFSQLGDTLATISAQRSYVTPSQNTDTFKDDNSEQSKDDTTEKGKDETEDSS